MARTASRTCCGESRICRRSPADRFDVAARHLQSKAQSFRGATEGCENPSGPVVMDSGCAAEPVIGPAHRGVSSRPCSPAAGASRVAEISPDNGYSSYESGLMLHRRCRDIIWSAWNVRRCTEALTQHEHDNNYKPGIERGIVG
jgi:hypothetical protein